MNPPIIALGQQPNGFFPKRFFYAKLQTARNLQKEIGGKIVLFYHDSDADYRETITLFRDRNTNAEVRLNFLQENKVQKNFSPLYLKRIPQTWKPEMLKQLPRFMEKNLIELFESVAEKTVADFCLEMYKKLGLLDGIEVVRSSESAFREKAADLNEDFYADVPYENEIVRAKILQRDGKNFGSLHHGGGKTSEFEINDDIKKPQKSAGRDDRFKWMNSVLHATHYITGNSEYDYLKRELFPEVKFIKRDQIEDQEFAWLPT
jgi:hypothetical protein